MEESKKRWSVTYTKHMTQKRKVYQDGSVVFQISTNKINLYDCSDNLLESRVLRKDEVISSGQSLSFNSFLVDVWDPHGGGDDNNNNNNKKTPIASSDLKQNHNRRRNGLDMNTARKRPINLSPSQKIIREFKKHELHKYGALRSSPDTTSTSITEWQVLYTGQLTQKVKKYHDGFLQLSTSGSASRQVMLFDGTRRLIDSRFLKKSETIETGESISLDAHLVEIGEDEGIRKQPVVKIEGKKCHDVLSNRSVKRELTKSEVHTDVAAPSIDDSCTTEWQVMYTTQVTQKAKKYHDGFLQLAICGSFERQVKLFDTSKQVLTSRFLIKDEVIRPDESITFGGYLVQIGEPEKCSQSAENLNIQTNNKMPEKTGIVNVPKNGLQESKTTVKVAEKSQNISCSEQNADSHSSKTVSMNRPVRDAHQILSFLQKPICQPAQSTVMNQVLGANVDTLVCDEPRTEQLHNVSSESLSTSEARDGCDTRNATNIMSTKTPVLGNSSTQVTGDSASRNTQQLKKPKTESALPNEAFGLDGAQKNSHALETDDFPSFDLGF